MPAEKNRKFFDLRNGLKAVDFRNKDYFDRIDDKEKSLYSPYMLMRYVSNVSSKDPFYIEHYIEMVNECCLLYTSPSPRDGLLSRMPSSA